MPKAKTYGPLLLHRFGPDLLRDGYKITPDVLEEYRLRLHLSTGEVRLIVYLWNKWKLYEEKISLPVKAIADALHVTARRVRQLAHALKEKGLLDVFWQPGRGRHNWYDLRPLCEKLRALVRGFPLPRRRGEVTTLPYKNAGMVQPKLGYIKGELWATIDSISRQFKDTAPKSSLTRAARIFFTLGLPLEAYKVWIQEARQRTKDFWAGVDTPMSYFFAILEQGPHARIDQADLRAGLDPRPAAPASAAESASAQETAADEAGFYWDDSPLPETDQAILTPIGATEAIATTTLACIIEVPDQFPIFIGSYRKQSGVAPQPENSEQRDQADPPRPAQAPDQQEQTSPAPLDGAPPTDAPAFIPDYMRLAAALQYPRVSVLADDGESWRVVEGEQGWNDFRQQSSKEEQRRALLALHKKERSAPARAGRLINRAVRWRASRPADNREGA